MKMKKFIAVLAAASMVAAMAAGCGSNEDTTAEGDAATEEGGEAGSWDAAHVRKDQVQEEPSQSCSVLLMKKTTI